MRLARPHSELYHSGTGWCAGRKQSPWPRKALDKWSGGVFLPTVSTRIGAKQCSAGSRATHRALSGRSGASFAPPFSGYPTLAEPSPLDGFSSTPGHGESSPERVLTDWGDAAVVRYSRGMWSCRPVERTPNPLPERSAGRRRCGTLRSGGCWASPKRRRLSRACGGAAHFETTCRPR